MLLIPGLERVECFPFPNNWKIIADYIFSESGVIDSNCNLGNRSSGNLRRSKLFHDGILISESIEDNPHYLSNEEIAKLIDEGEFIGKEFERTMNFPNGYVAKIEYCNSKDKHDDNLGIYRSKYMRMVLLDENNQVVVDVIQKNPHFGETPYTREDENWYKNSAIV